MHFPWLFWFVLGGFNDLFFWLDFLFFRSRRFCVRRALHFLGIFDWFLFFTDFFLYYKNFTLCKISSLICFLRSSRRYRAYLRACSWAWGSIFCIFFLLPSFFVTPRVFDESKLGLGALGFFFWSTIYFWICSLYYFGIYFSSKGFTRCKRWCYLKFIWYWVFSMALLAIMKVSGSLDHENMDQLGVEKSLLIFLGLIMVMSRHQKAFFGHLNGIVKLLTTKYQL